MEQKKSVYERITELLVKQLEAGVCPWRQAWNNVTTEGRYISHRSGNQYSFLNCILLMCQHKAPGEFLTLKQANEEGGTVKKGAHGATVFFYTMWDKKTDETDEDGNPITEQIPVLKTHTVFALEDCNGVNPRHAQEPKQQKPLSAKIMKALTIVGAYSKNQGPAIDTATRNDAHYLPVEDKVCTPTAAQFENKARFIEVLFHECGHSTGHPDRLNRKTLTAAAASGGEDYNREELVAEITAAYLCGHVGIEADMLEQSAAYLAGWLTFLQENPREFATAAAQAEKAAKFILEKAGEL